MKKRFLACLLALCLLVCFAPAAFAAEGDAVYSGEEFTPDRPLVVWVSFPGVLPTVGLSYTDTDGSRRTLHIGMSGKDGSFFLAEP